MKITIPDQEFFLSERWRKFVDAHIKSIIRGSKVSCEIVYEPDNDAVAYTNGSHIWINAASEIISFYTLLSRRASAFLGVLNHELAHILFLDFEKEKKISEDIRNGILPAQLTGSPETNGEIEAAMQEEAFRGVFDAFYSETSNIVADAHDEYKMCSRYEGDVASSIECAASVLQSTVRCFEDQVADSESVLGRGFQLTAPSYIERREMIRKAFTLTLQNHQRASGSSQCSRKFDNRCKHFRKCSANYQRRLQ